MTPDVQKWVEQLRFEASYLAPEESRIINLIVTVALIVVVIFQGVSVSGLGIAAALVFTALVVIISLLMYVLLTRGGKVARESRKFAEEYRKLASRVYGEDLTCRND